MSILGIACIKEKKYIYKFIKYNKMKMFESKLEFIVFSKITMKIPKIKVKESVSMYNTIYEFMKKSKCESKVFVNNP